MMTRWICVFLVACTAQAKPAPVAPTPPPLPPKVERPAPPPPRNFVCESFATVNPKAVCTAELTDAPPHSTHSARIAIDAQLIRCMLNSASPSIVCSDLIVVQMVPPPPVEDKKPAPKKPAAPKKKGK